MLYAHSIIVTQGTKVFFEWDLGTIGRAINLKLRFEVFNNFSRQKWQEYPAYLINIPLPLPLAEGWDLHKGDTLVLYPNSVRVLTLPRDIAKGTFDDVCLVLLYKDASSKFSSAGHIDFLKDRFEMVLHGV